MARIFHGEITGDPYRPARSITSYDLDPDVQVGDLVARWDHYFIWDEACITGKELEKLRWTGDDLCDDVVKFLGMGRGDMLAKLEEYMSTTPTDKWDVRVRKFWESVDGQPPNGVDTSDGEFRPNFEHQSKCRTLSRGQEVFWKYISPILTSLLHFSLVGILRLFPTLILGGFSAPKIIEVLLHTSYLTSSSSALTNRRLFETTQMVLDAMNDMTPSSGLGFRSVLKVRMLHSHVRLRLLHSPKFDTEKYGVPINQEDLLATLGAFSVACIWSMERMGIYIANEDKDAYIAAWKHIGYYMGIQPAYLERFYKDYHAAEKHLCSSIAHLLEPELGKPSGMLPLQLLNGISNRPLYGHSIQYHAELSRLLIGDELADVFQLPRGNLRTRVGLWGSLTLMKLELWFGRWYRSGWERERVRLMKEFVDWLVMWQVGKRQAFERTDFGYKVVVVEDIVAKGKGEKVNGKVNGTIVADLKDNQVEETDGNVRVQVDRAYIKALKRRYYRIIVFEPVVLVGGIVCAVGWTLWTWNRQ
jgi:hypothetical protein